MNIILASASPRRQELLKRLFSDFTIDPAEVDESLNDDIGAEFAPIFLAAVKAEAVAEKHPKDLIIAADTVVICEGKILGKPTDAEDARAMLKMLSGKEHKVITGCCLRLGDECATFSEETVVSFFPIEEKEIEDYINCGEPFGKAGAYGIQGQGAFFVKKIDGDYYNVVGLPLGRLKRELRDMGYLF